MKLSVREILEDVSPEEWTLDGRVVETTVSESPKSRVPNKNENTGLNGTRRTQ